VSGTVRACGETMLLYISVALGFLIFGARPKESADVAQEGSLQPCFQLEKNHRLVSRDGNFVCEKINDETPGAAPTRR